MRLLVTLSSLPLLALFGQDTETQKKSKRVEQIVSNVDQARLMSGVEKLVSFKTRNTFSDQDDKDEGIGAAYRWLHAEFEKIKKGCKSDTLVDYHHFTYRRTKCRNVFLWMKGKRYPKKVIVHGAHYDSINLRARRNPDAPAPGANDNASGTSAVLEMARVLAPHTFDVGVILIAFAGEEYGLHGAKAFSKFLEESGIEVVAMINTDTIGGSKDDEGNIDDATCRCFSGGPEGSRHRTVARAVKHLIELYQPEFTVRLQDRIDRPGRGGDHQAFAQRGMPAVRLIVTHEELKKQHTANDLPESMDWDYLTKMSRGVATLLGNFAAGPLPPEGLRARNGRVTWRKVRGASGYAVFVRKSGSNALHEVVHADGTRVELDALEAGDGVAVAAVSKKGEMGVPSEELEIE